MMKRNMLKVLAPITLFLLGACTENIDDDKDDDEDRDRSERSDSGSAGDGGSAGSGGSCLPAGEPCGSSTPCCSDSVCVDHEGYGAYCGYICSGGYDCASGCCAGPLGNGVTHVCAPDEFCGGGSSGAGGSSAACQSLCAASEAAQCPGASNCLATCNSQEAEALMAGCDSEWDDLVVCLNEMLATGECDLDAWGCPAYDILQNCVQEYCDQNPGAC